MRRVLKWLAILAGALVLLLIIAIIVVPLYFDPNDYRDQIGDVVEQQTGRELTIGGDIELSLFPWIGVKIHEVSLGNAEGFGPDPFATVENAEVRVKLLPLLRQQVEMDTAVLDGLRLSLARDAQGRTNWDDLIAEAAEQPEEEPADQREGQPLAGLAIGGLAVSDARVVWDDAMTGRQVEVAPFDLESGAIELGEPFPLEFRFTVKSNQPQLSGEVAFESQLMLNPDTGLYSADDARLETDLQSPLFPNDRLQATLASTLSANFNEQTARLDSLRLSAYGAELNGEAEASRILELPDARGTIRVATEDAEALATLLAGFGLEAKPAALKDASMEGQFETSLSDGTANLDALSINVLGLSAKLQATASNLLDEPGASGQLEIEPFVPSEVVEGLGIELPQPSDPSVLSKATLTTRFEAGAERISLADLKAQLDDTNLTGSASFGQPAAPVIRFDLLVDAIDVDRYLPPPEEEESRQPATPGGAAAAGAAQLPVETLRSMDIDGTVRVGQLQAANLRSDDIRVTMRAEKGLFRAHPASARLYGGTYQGNVVFDVREEVPRLGMDERLDGVQAGPLLEDMMGEAHVTGTASVSAKLSARGLEQESVRRTLNGNAAFEFRDGTVKGINIAHLIRTALAKYQGRPAPEEEAQETDFALLQGTFNIKDGLVSNQDLNAKSPLLRIDGQGTANLVSEELDYRVRTAIVGSLEGQKGKELEELKGVTIPLRITGTFQDPKFRVDVESVLKERVEKEVEERVEEEKGKLREELEEKLKGRLEGLFR
ncbi:AsmA family protein [Thiohalomonas denitrificans]|uniref:AsmA protein n=1 Tax=Thiohalomonas denitrificans TaxID=415747 RepID=A0A1G5QUV0_9GAMM|nr:AsmA family protein [Thiohalomonas denitrificans]SCZ64859.1 AsmA protein [Thiohalomonas denitrificans]